MSLSEVLTARMLASAGPEGVRNRANVQIVEQEAELAAKNHLPTTEGAEHKSQESARHARPGAFAPGPQTGAKSRGASARLDVNAGPKAVGD